MRWMAMTLMFVAAPAVAVTLAAGHGAGARDSLNLTDQEEGTSAATRTANRAAERAADRAARASERATVRAADRIERDELRYPSRDTEQVQRSLAFSGAGAKRVEVDNVWGSIQLAAYDGATVELSVKRTLKARTPELLEQARKDVTLDITEEPSLINLYVDGPFRDCDGRCGDSDGRHVRRARRWSGDLGYVVHYDFVIKVPRAVSLGLRTVNGGDIHVDGTVGDFDVQNVNGGIEMLNVAGSGDAHTVNGPVTVLFQRNPAAASSFKSINGELIVYFDPSLQAELWMKTMNGKFYSDFDTRALTSLAPVAERTGGKYVFRFDRGTRVQVGRGGPALSFETLNGDIRILHRGQ